MKKLIVAIIAILGPSVALAAGPATNCLDGGLLFTSDGGGTLNATFQQACRQSNPISITSDATNIYVAEMGSLDAGFQDGVVRKFPVDGGAVVSSAGQNCPVAVVSNGTRLAWINDGLNCLQIDAGTAGNTVNAALPALSTVFTLAEANGIQHVAMDALNVYYDISSKLSNGLKSVALYSVPIDGGVSTLLWNNMNSNVTVAGQTCQFTNGGLNCPQLGISNMIPDEPVSSLAINAAGNLMWGPLGFQIPVAGGTASLPVNPVNNLSNPIKSITALDAGFIYSSGSNIVNGQNNPLATNLDTTFGAWTTDQTNIYYACNNTGLGTVSLCKIPVASTKTLPVFVQNEVVPQFDGGSANFKWTLAAPTVATQTLVVQIQNVQPGGSAVPIAYDSGDAGLLNQATTLIPANLPTMLDGGLVNSTGVVFLNLTGPLPPGASLTANYMGQTTSATTAAPQVIWSGFPLISGLTVDTYGGGGLDFVVPGPIPDAGAIWSIQPKP